MIDLRKVYAALVASAPRALSLYEIMEATGIGGWDCAGELKRLSHDGRAIISRDSGAARFRVAA